MGRRTASLLGGLLLSLALAAALPLHAPATAQTPAPPGGGFDLPLDCAMWEVCAIQNYVDHDPGPGWTDHACGHLSYDGHRGTDFRVPTLIEMRRGVAVIAAAAGEVIVVEDGVEDRLMQDTGPGKTPRERNGNRVAIHHGDGWVTTYAHLMKGTLAVEVGDQVERGEKLGLIGLSGNSDFPHVHFAVSYQNTLLDPFTGEEPSAACGGTGPSLWSPAAQAELTYRAGGLLSAGFLDYQPSHREMQAGIPMPAQISAEERTLVFWAATWGLREGDREVLQILRPDGTTFFHRLTEIEKNHAIWTKTFGLRQRDKDLMSGEYIGFYRVLRPDDDWLRTVLAERLTVTVR